MKFFRKLNPRNSVVLADKKTKITFDTIDDLTGYFKTDNEGLISFFKQCVKENRYGLCEISEEEYERDFAEKKRNGIDLRPTWERESIGGRSKKTNPLRVLGARAVVAAVSTNEDKNVAKEADLRMDGPTVEEYVRQGYKAENYPPRGYAVRTESVAPTLGKRQ